MIASAKPANQLGRRKSSSLSSRSALRQQKGPSPKDHSTERQKRRRRNTNRSLARSLSRSLFLSIMAERGSRRRRRRRRRVVGAASKKYFPTNFPRTTGCRNSGWLEVGRDGKRGRKEGRNKRWHFVPSLVPPSFPLP